MAVADDVLAHYGIELSEDELAHYGKKGMKWGVRKDDSTSSSGGSGWTDDQKKKLKVVGGIALVATVAAGAYFGARALQSSGSTPVNFSGMGKTFLDSLDNKKIDTSHLNSTFVSDFAKSMGGNAKTFTAKAASGKKMAEETLRKSGNKKLLMDPELKKFIKDGPSRILQDQKEWSKFLGKSLDSIQKEDLAFMNNQINLMKALGA